MPEPDVRNQLAELLRERGCERRDEAFQLSSGQWSHDIVDAKLALADGPALVLGCEAVLAVADDLGAPFEAVGGLTMGADHLAHGVAMLRSVRWFSVRKAAKQHGRQQRIEGAELRRGDHVLLVEDVVTTGGSILQALDAIEVLGAHAVAAVSLVDRGDEAADRLHARGVPFQAVTTYRELGIEPVGGPADPAR